MRRNTTGGKLEELKKKVKQQAKKDMDKLLDINIKKEVRGPKYIATKKSKDQRVLDQIEEKNRVEFFKKFDKGFNTMEDNEVIASITDFGEKGDDKRKVFAKVLLEAIPPKKLKKYVKDVIGGANSDDLLNSMKFKTANMTKKDAEIADDINNVIQNEQSMRAHERFANIIASKKGDNRISAYDLYIEDMNKAGVIDQITIIKNWKTVDQDTKNAYKAKALEINKKNAEESKKSKKEAIVIDDEADRPRVVMDIIDYVGKTRPSIDTQALYDYMRHLWIPDYSSTYITTPANMTVVMDPKFIIDSGRDDDSIVYEGRTWYRPSKYFYLMQIGRFADDRKQDGINLVCFDGSLENPIAFNVLHKSKDNKVIVQNEKVFKDEKDWMKKKVVGQDKKLNEFINTPIESLPSSVVDAISIFMRKYLAITLTTQLSNAGKKDDQGNTDGNSFKLNPTDIDDPIFTENDSFITDLESAFMIRANGKTIDYYVGEISAFLVFVESSFIGRKYNIFKSRLRANMYNPSKIPSLSIEEKIPEIFDNPTVPDTKDDNTSVRTKDVIKASIEFVINCRKKTLACVIYNHLYPMDIIFNIPICQYSIPTIADPTNLRQKNGCDIDTYYPHETVYYREGDKTYCFNIYEIINMISNDIKINPFTNNPFSDEFVDSILSFNDNVLFDFDYNLQRESASVMGETKGYPMIDDLFTKIADLEQSHMNKTEPGMKNTEEIVVDEIPSESEETVAAEIPKEEFIDEIAMSPFSDTDRVTKCDVCGTPIQGDAYKTILDSNDDVPNVVNLCSTKCFSEWNEGK